MRVASCFLVIASVSLSATPLAAQGASADSARGMSVNVAGGVSRYGPHGITALEYSMNRWLAARGEVFFGLRNWTRDLNGSRVTGLNVAAVVSAPELFRVTPYLLAGSGFSLSQGASPEFGPLGGGGLRFRLGRFTPYVEARAQHRAGIPISIGIRF